MRCPAGPCVKYTLANAPAHARMRIATTRSSAATQRSTPSATRIIRYRSRWRSVHAASPFPFRRQTVYSEFLSSWSFTARCCRR